MKVVQKKEVQIIQKIQEKIRNVTKELNWKLVRIFWFIGSHTEPIKSLVLLANQKYFASLSIEKEIKIWYLNKGSLIKAIISNDVIYSMTVLKNGNILSRSINGHIRIWDVEKGSVKKRAFYGPNRIWCLAVKLIGGLEVGIKNGNIKILPHR